MKKYLPFIVILAVVLVFQVIALESLNNKLKKSEARRTAAEHRAEGLEARLAEEARAREIDQQTLSTAERARDETQKRFITLHDKVCTLGDDTRIDDGLRELAREAYRVAICTEADDQGVPAAAGPGKP